MADIIRMNGVVVHDSRITLAQAIEEKIAVAHEEISKMNRDTRRHKHMKKLLTLFGVVGTIATTSIAQAQELETDVANVDVKKGFPEKIADALFNKIVGSMADGNIPTGGIAKEDTMLWKLNELASETILKTQDFFQNTQIVGMFTTVWYITMSFSTLIIAKKGIDMIKAKAMGSSTLGVQQLIIRLLASVVLSFISLDVMSLGIELSNLTIQSLMKNFGGGFLNITNTGTHISGYVFWFLAYLCLFGILMVTYWIRQLTLVIIGVLSPVANMAYVVDGGSMLGTLIKEVVTNLSTPIIQGSILAIGSVVMTEVVSVDSPTAWLQSLMLNLSMMCMMIFTPTVLRRFITDSFNPLKWAVGAVSSVKALPLKLAKLLK